MLELERPVVLPSENGALLLGFSPETSGLVLGTVGRCLLRPPSARSAPLAVDPKYVKKRKWSVPGTLG